MLDYNDSAPVKEEKGETKMGEAQGEAEGASVSKTVIAGAYHQDREIVLSEKYTREYREAKGGGIRVLPLAYFLRSPSTLTPVLSREYVFSMRN